MKRSYLICALLLISAVTILFVSCGGGGGGGGGSALQPPTYNASGTWAVTENSKNGNCSQMSPLNSFNLSVNHPPNSNSLVVTDQKTNVQYTGTISGSIVNFSGPSIDSNCPGGISISVTLTMSSDSYLSGSSGWTCNYTGGSCSGTTSFTASKTGGGSDTTDPTVPAGLSVTAASASQINLAWTASTDNVGVAGYRVYHNGSLLKQVAGTSTSDTGLSANTQYCYSVSAYDAANNESAQCAQKCATTQSGGGGDTIAPSTPTNLTGSAASSSQINLSWTASTDNVGVTGYRLERCQGASCSSFSQIATPTTTSYNNTGLTASTSYTYRVRAVDAAGNLSGYSNTFSATTLGGGATTVTLYATRDAEIAWSDASNSIANTNYGNSIIMELGNYFLYGSPFSSYLKTGLLVDFTFDNATWSGKTITSAKLRLYVYDYAVQSYGRYVAYKIVDEMIGGNYKYPWAEMGVTWNNAPPYSLSPTSTAYAPVDPAQYTEWDVTSMAQEWFTSGTMGNGIIILDMEPPPSIYDTTNQITTYCSRQYVTQAYRPRLIITY